MEKRKIIVGSRDSVLAVAQTKLVMEAIRRANPGIELELVTRKTTGDMILDKTLDKIGGKGLFVKELDQGLLAGEIDIAVHSLKDMPMEENPELPIAAFFMRGDPRDVLVMPAGQKDPGTLDGMDAIGTSSARRQLQIRDMYPEAGLKSIRGNIITRLDKLDRGEYSALVLAASGLMRAGLEDRISRYFSPEEMVPAAGQGILAVQARRDLDVSFLEAVNDRNTAFAAAAERSFVAALDGGCSSPIAAYAEIDGETLKLTGLYFNEDTKEHSVDSITGDRTEAKQLGQVLAARMKGGLS